MPIFGRFQKAEHCHWHELAVTVVMVLATAVTWPIYTYLLVPSGLAYLQTIVFILIIAALVQLLKSLCGNICLRCITPWACICR